MYPKKGESNENYQSTKRSCLKASAKPLLQMHPVTRNRFYIADRPTADVTAIGAINQFKKWTGLYNTVLQL
jgi:hypothetical protein